MQTWRRWIFFCLSVLLSLPATRGLASEPVGSPSPGPVPPTGISGWMQSSIVGDAPAFTSDASCAPSTNSCDPPKILMGDLYGFQAMRMQLVPRFQTVTVTTMTIRRAGTGGVTRTTKSSTLTQLFLDRISVCDPYASRIAFKIGDNESVLPQDRVFLTYGFANAVPGAGGFSPASLTTSSSTMTAQGVTTATTTSTSTSGVIVPGTRINANGEVAGFEKTLFDGNASVGVRLPILQQSGDGGVDRNGFGDLSIITKAILYKDVSNGLAFSGGLMVTVPTGLPIDTIYGNINSVLWQPYVGYYWAQSDFYVQGFVSGIIPTNDHDVTLLVNTLGCGYTVYRSPSGMLSSVTPLLEVDVTNPLNHRGSCDPISVPDLVDLTTGVHLGVGSRGLLSLGVTFPVTNPHVYDIGALVRLNYRF
jgi:hypothetical protein